jgi:hypothetical protein
MQHCKECADACRRCAALCRSMSNMAARQQASGMASGAH